MIYFIQAGDERGPVKIGYAAHNARTRLKALQTAHYERLRLLRVIPGTRRTERSLHTHFRASHIRLEWFRYDPAMLTIETDIGVGVEDGTEPFRLDRASQVSASTPITDGLPANILNRLIARAFAAGVSLTEMAQTILCAAIVRMDDDRARADEEAAMFPHPPPAIEPALARRA